MEFHNADRWIDLLGFDPAPLDSEEVLQQVAGRLRLLCNSLNQHADRRSVTRDLRQLQQIGGLLESHQWLNGRET